jgi:hypothetical protein
MTGRTAQGGVLVLSFVLAVVCCACPYLFGTFATYHLNSLLLGWLASVAACLLIDWKCGKWSLLSAPIALFPLILLAVGCLIYRSCP